MVSESKALAKDLETNGVLILVLVEDGLRERDGDDDIYRADGVLILVLVEDGLRGCI